MTLLSALPTSVPSSSVPSRPDAPTWEALVRGVLADPGQLELHFQPIVSFADASVVGYEALSRFRPHGVDDRLARSLTPDLWYAEADRIGVGAELEAVAIARAFAVRDSLPPNCFLTVNASPHLVTEPVVRDLLLNAGPLEPLVVELTEHSGVDDLSSLVRLRDDVADRGGLLALDDAGAGYSGLQQMTRLRPHLIKLDRALVADADTDEVKLALAELLGEFAGRIDAWLLAEGIETWGELDAFVRLGVPLGQGYLLGRPGPGFAELDRVAVDHLRTVRHRSSLVENVASLVELPWTTDVVPRPEGFSLPDRAGHVGLHVDARRRPVSLLVPRPGAADGHTHRVAPPSLRVPSSEGVPQLAGRMMARPPEVRFDPVVVVDELGRVVGVVRVERVMLALAAARPS